ncbi:MAG: zf-HC2 domain-containing protein [Bacteroidales bacterium]|nr:zf-HC2 domain-containing protein [Candidatus Latescibacterota bacterium]
MNERCEYFRNLLADSISSALTPSNRSELDEHLGRCPACREYSTSLTRDDRLLHEYPNLFDRPVSEIKAALIESLEDVADPATRKPVPFWRNVMKMKYAAMILAVIAAVWAIGYFSGAFRVSSPALARVLEEIGKARDLSYRLDYEIEGLDPFESFNYINNSGVRRKETPCFHTATITDGTGGIEYWLHEVNRKAVLTYKVGKPPKEKLSEYLDWVQTLHKKSAEFVRMEEINGRSVQLFVNNEDIYYKIRVWVDPETDLPVKAQFVAVPNPNYDIISPRIGLTKIEFGVLSGESKMISYKASGGITMSSTVTMNDMVWNTNLNDSLFILDVPEGYTLEVDSLDVSYNLEKDLIDALAIWTKMSGSAFPENINDLGTGEIVQPLLVSFFDGKSDPEKEFDKAYGAANTLCKGCVFAQEMKVEKTWNYMGMGKHLGNGNEPICWWKEEGAKMFRIMYGDLRVEDIREDDLPEH